MSEHNEYVLLLLKILDSLRIDTMMSPHSDATKIHLLEKVSTTIQETGMQRDYMVDYGPIIYEAISKYQSNLRQESPWLKTSNDIKEIEMCDRMIRTIPKAYRT